MDFPDFDSSCARFAVCVDGDKRITGYTSQEQADSEIIPCNGRYIIAFLEILLFVKIEKDAAYF